MKFFAAILPLLFFMDTAAVKPLPPATALNKPRVRPVEIEMTVKNIRNNNGKVLIGFFKDNESFAKEIPIKGIQESKAAARNGVLTLKTTLEPGVYGAALMDDENGNGKMDYNLIGIPKEGFGFSNYYHTGFFKPKIYPFQFEVKESQPTKVEFYIRYLL